MLLLVIVLFAACKPKTDASKDEVVNKENNDSALNSTKDLLVKTWKVTGDQFIGEEMKYNFSQLAISLLKDGTVSVEGGKMKGTYTVGEDGKSITTVDDEDGTVRFDILLLTKNNLKVVTTALNKPAHTFTLESQ